jgi:hypothetical protein
MGAMFQRCTSFNQPLVGTILTNTWVLNKNLDTTGMIKLFVNCSSLNPTNLSKTLIYWHEQYKSNPSSFPKNVQLTNLPVQPTDDGLIAKNNLITDAGWIFT